MPAAVGTEQPHMSGWSRRPRADFLPNAAKRMGAARLNCGFRESPPGSPPLGCVIVPSTFCFPSCVPVRSPEPKAFSVTRERGPRRARECHPVCDFSRDSARRFSRPKPFVPMRRSVSIFSFTALRPSSRFCVFLKKWFLTLASDMQPPPSSVALDMASHASLCGPAPRAVPGSTEFYRVGITSL